VKPEKKQTSSKWFVLGWFKIVCNILHEFKLSLHLKYDVLLKYNSLHINKVIYRPACSLRRRQEVGDIVVPKIVLEQSL
jgi:hypothetical protein